MHTYILKLPYEFEAFQLAIELNIINYVPEESFTKEENDEEEVIVYTVQFKDEDIVYEFDRKLRDKAPYIFKNKL